MITNGYVTIYHKELNPEIHKEEWNKFVYKAWHYGGKGANTNKGYENANDIDIKIPYNENKLDINNFSIGDIIFIGVGKDITRQSELKESYNITSIIDNTYGRNTHIQLGGK